MCGFNNKRDGDWSDSAVVTNTDRTEQTIELINRIEILEKVNKSYSEIIKKQNETIDELFENWRKCNNYWFISCMIINLIWFAVLIWRW